MNELIAALGMMYACNLLAERGPVSADLAFHCGRAHETVKLQFLTAEEVDQLGRLPLREQNAIKLKGYLRFKTWEGDHRDFVSGIREMQRERLESGKSAPAF